MLSTYPGYDCYTSPCGPNKCGLAIYIKHVLWHHLLDANDYSSDTIVIQYMTILGEHQEWRIYNVNAHVDHLSDERNWDFLSEMADSDWEITDSWGF